MFSPHFVHPEGNSDPTFKLWTRLPSASRWSLQPAAMPVRVASEMSAGRPRLVRSVLRRLSDCAARVGSLADAVAVVRVVRPAQARTRAVVMTTASDSARCTGPPPNPRTTGTRGWVGDQSTRTLGPRSHSHAGRSASSDPEDARSGLGQFGGEDHCLAGLRARRAVRR